MLKRIAARVASNPRAYELIQALLGARVVFAELQRVIPNRNVLTLDVGSSSGGVVARIVEKTIAIDIDLAPLALRARVAVQADARAIPLRAKTVPAATCVGVSHHLDDAGLAAALAEIARVTSGVFVFVDAVRNDGRFLSRLLWRYDRGANPRTAVELESALARDFEIERVVRFQYLHQYWLAIARPRR